MLQTLPNVELRGRVQDVRTVYRDARALLVPFTFNTRPRVVLEAQANEIPVLATDTPSLAEAVGDGGLLVGSDVAIEGWVRSLRRLLEPELHAVLAAAAGRHAERDDVNPDRIVRSFETAMSDAVAHFSRRGISSGRGEVR